MRYPIVHVVQHVQKACDIAAKNANWIILVYPERSDYAATVQQMMGSIFPANVSVSGRTGILPNGGRVSLIEASTGTKNYSHVPFDVMFVGWGDDLSTNIQRMTLWRTSARSVIT